MPLTFTASDRLAMMRVLVGARGATGISPQVYVQNSAPSTTATSGALWIDADSADSDLYQLTSGAWVDTGVDLKGDDGAAGDPAPASAPLTVSTTALTYATTSHDGKAIRFTNASGCTVTLTTGEANGEGFSWYQTNGAGQILFTVVSGSLLHSRDHDRSFGANSVGSCFVNQDQEWVLCGDTEPPA